MQQESVKEQELRVKRSEILLRKVLQRIQTFPAGLIQISWKGASVIVKFTSDIVLDEMDKAELEREEVKDGGL